MKIPSLKGFDQEAFNKYLKNTGWLMFGKMLSLLVSLVITRYLGPKQYGDLSFAIALVTITSAIGALGLDSFIVREIINEPNKKDEILGTAFWLRILTNTLLIPITIAIYLSYHYFTGQDGKTLTLMVALLALTSVFKSFNVIDSYFQSQVQSKYVVHVQNICLITSAIIKVLIVSLGLPLIYIVFALVFDAFILALGLVLIYHLKASKVVYWTFSKARAKSLLIKSFPLILSAIVITLYMKIDVVMLKESGSEVVGIYSAAANLSEAWYFIPIAIISSVFPAIINARKTDYERYKKRMRNLYDLLVFISVPVAIFISIFANFIVEIIYQNKFYGSGAILSIHIWSGVFVFLGVASSQYLLAEGYTKIAFYRGAMGAIANILLNIWLIPLYGGIGASIATLIACFISTFYLLVIPKTRAQGIMMLKALFFFTVFQKIFKR